MLAGQIAPCRGHATLQDTGSHAPRSSQSRIPPAVAGPLFGTVNDSEPSRRPIAARNTSWAAAIARALAKVPVKPNVISVGSAVFGGVAGLAFWLAGRTETPVAWIVCLLGAAGYRLHYVNISTGSCGSLVHRPPTLRRIRRREARKAAAIFGATFHESRAEDLEILYTVPLLRWLTGIIRQARPTIVLTHSPHFISHFTVKDLAVIRKEEGRSVFFRPASVDSILGQVERPEGEALARLYVTGELEGVRRTGD